MYKVLLLIVLLSGCSSLNVMQAAVAQQGAVAADELRETASWTLCRAISVGAWSRAYGNDPKKSEAWRVLCSEPITQTPSVKVDQTP